MPDSSFVPTNRWGAEVVKHLGQIAASGRHQYEIFEDFLDVALAILEATPRHITSLRESGKLADDTPEAQAMFKSLWERYEPKRYQHHFQAAYRTLMQSAEDGLRNRDYLDILGEVYMAWGYPNKHTGQFFTPYSLAKACAEMTVADGEREVHGRLKEAVSQSMLSQAALIAGQIVEDATEAQQWYFERVLPPAMEFYKPVTVCDPACGSGVMLLAAAAMFPQWMTAAGLVQFFGQDIDLTCVKMCRINMMLYQLNNYGARLLVAANPGKVQPVAPARDAAAEVVEVAPVVVAEVLPAVAAGSQLKLF